MIGFFGCGKGVSRLASKITGAPSAGQTYYVSTAGSNSNPGTNARPWGTPGYGAKHIKSGDTLIVLGGRYVLSSPDQDIIVPPSGKRGALTVVKGEQGNRPVFAGRENLLSAIDISGKRYIRIENLEITSNNGEPFRGGIEATGGQIEHIVIDDLYIHHIDEGGVNAADVNYLQVLNCNISYCGSGAVGGPGGEHGGWRNIIIKGCKFSYSGHYFEGGDGSDRSDDRPDGVGIEASIGPVQITDTVVEHNYGDGLDVKADDTLIHNCTVANNSGDGVKLWRDGSRVDNTLIYGTGDGVTGGSPWGGIVIDKVDRKNSHFEIVNVTVDDNPEREAYPAYVQYETRGMPITLTIRNCIFAHGFGLIYIDSAVKLSVDHNIFYRTQGDVQIHANGRDYTRDQLSELGTGNIYADPLFISPAWGGEGDYHLRLTSPAIGAGNADGAPSKDLDGRSRGKVVDIGAYAGPLRRKKP